MPSYQKLQDKTIVTFVGKLDTVTCIDFEEDLYEKIEENDLPVVFDLKAVDSISSMFLRICSKVSQKVSKERFSIINVSDTAMKVFELTKLNNFLNISQ